MDTRVLGIRKIIALALVAALTILSIWVLSARISLAEGEENKDENKPEITIEVVEEIPAAEIEEQEVPLAESPLTAAAGNTRQTVVTWTLGAVVLAYVVFIISGMRLRKTRRQMQAGTSGDRGGNDGGASV